MMRVRAPARTAPENQTHLGSFCRLTLASRELPCGLRLGIYSALRRPLLRPTNFVWVFAEDQLGLKQALKFPCDISAGREVAIIAKRQAEAAAAPHSCQVHVSNLIGDGLAILIPGLQCREVLGIV